MDAKKSGDNPTSAQAASAGAKVLVIEDDKYLTSAYNLKLTRSGFDVKIAGDGKQALDIVKDFRPDIILLDLAMPSMNGYEFLTILRKNPDHSTIPVIVATNSGEEDETLQKVKSIGVADSIIKSDLSLNDLVTRINKILQKPSA